LGPQPRLIPPGQVREQRLALQAFREGRAPRRPDVSLEMLGGFSLDSCLFYVQASKKDGRK
jgi:hypothetical protein